MLFSTIVTSAPRDTAPACRAAIVAMSRHQEPGAPSGGDTGTVASRPCAPGGTDEAPNGGGAPERRTMGGGAGNGGSFVVGRCSSGPLFESDEGSGPVPCTVPPGWMSPISREI
jgi:hypothetical protein